MRKNCFRLLSLTVLAVAVTSISAFAADASIDTTLTDEGRTAGVELTPNGTEKVNVTCSSAQADKEYLIMVQSGDNEIPDVDNLVYIDQKTADGTAFIVYPKEMKDGTTYHVYLSSNADSGITARQEVGTFTYSAGQSDYTLGDVNDDKTINVRDALAIVNHVVENKILTGNNLLAADTTGDGAVNTRDALEIVNYVVGRPQHLKKG